MLPSAYNAPPRLGGSIPPRDSVIANSVLPLRILKFRAPVVARDIRGRTRRALLSAGCVAVDVEARGAFPRNCFVNTDNRILFFT